MLMCLYLARLQFRNEKAFSMPWKARMVPQHSTMCTRLALFHSCSLIQQFRYAYYILSSFIVINAIITHYHSFVWVGLAHFLSYILLALIVPSLALGLAFCLLSQFFNYIENIHQCSYLLQLKFTAIAVTMYVLLCAIWAPVFNAVLNVSERIGMLKQSVLIESNIWLTLRKLLICVRCVYPRRTDPTASFAFFPCLLAIQLSPRYGNYNE